MQLSRDQLKMYRAAARKGNHAAAAQLLAHSVALGHGRLSIRRFMIARGLHAPDIESFRPYCMQAAAEMPLAELLATARAAADCLPNKEGTYTMAADLLPSLEPYILPFDGVVPRFASEHRLCARGSCVLGKVEIGTHPLLAANAVIRADGHYVRIGDAFFLGENATVHIAHDVYPTHIGHRVTVGRNAVVHACDVGDDCVIEDNAVILDGSTVESGVVIEKGAVVFPRSKLDSGYLYAGIPAKPVRAITSEECEAYAARLRDEIAKSILVCEEANTAVRNLPSDVFVAQTATLSGHIELASGSSVFFGCRLEAGDYSIRVGRNVNIQDNSHIRCAAGDFDIGANSTIGHNVTLQDCRIGERSLIGIGCTVKSGTVVDDDVLLAAGAITEPGQHLESGWVWAGVPARPLAKIDDAKREMMTSIIGHYSNYAEAFGQAQSRLKAQLQGASNGTTASSARRASR